MRDTRKKEKKVNKTLYVTGVITGFIFITGLLFKIMHWPGAEVALAVSVLLTVAVFIPILVAHALDNYLQEIMVDIEQETQKDNHLAIAEDRSIDLSLIRDLDVHKSTELVIFGNELSSGQGEELIRSLEIHKDLLMSHAGVRLDAIIIEMLDTRCCDQTFTPRTTTSSICS